mmetsp:Transcript_30829/g.81739  ORF Transcript_30829/g.81739 Transcript_30829/m.81739 type:complete len:96 (-) Transcript_30829:27-314(-)
MADKAAPKDGDEAEKGQREVEQESPFKLCFFALLDVLATLARSLVAAWSAIKWATRRCLYPLKEAVLDRVDRFKQWYWPYHSKSPSGGRVPGFAY